MRRLLTLLSISIVCLAPSAYSAVRQPPVVPEPPELPSQIVSGESMAPDITITRKQKETITEYSVNGSIYMIKISPKNAPPYYMVDTDGDGNLETRRSDLENGMNIPQWLLFSW
ncbi:MAG: hypothetical protein COB89_01735 [Piscirickettsiaceae bacterium]|nr:MAG: hypothetical protein COB89_01735 [Piscirickettsiaceae bacterium]